MTSTPWRGVAKSTDDLGAVALSVLVDALATIRACITMHGVGGGSNFLLAMPVTRVKNDISPRLTRAFVVLLPDRRTQSAC